MFKTITDPPPPPSLPTPARSQTARSAADDVATPGLMLGSWFEVGDGHLHRLDLLMFGREGADLVGHFVAFDRNVLSLNAAGGEKKRKHTSERSLTLTFVSLDTSVKRFMMLNKERGFTYRPNFSTKIIPTI